MSSTEKVRRTTNQRILFHQFHTIPCEYLVSQATAVLERSTTSMRFMTQLLIHTRLLGSGRVTPKDLKPIIILASRYFLRLMRASERECNCVYVHITSPAMQVANAYRSFLVRLLATERASVGMTRPYSSSASVSRRLTNQISLSTRKSIGLEDHHWYPSFDRYLLFTSSY